MQITGVISASRPVILLGQIDGNIDAVSVHIKSTATVNGDINAEKVTIDGTVCGKVIADELHLSASAILRGDVQCNGIKIDEGATVEAKFTREHGPNG